MLSFHPLSRTVVRLFDLVEAEGRQLKEKTITTAVVIVLFMVAGVFVVVAFAFFLAALYQVLRLWLSLPLALLIIGVVCSLLATGVAWIAIRYNR